MFSYRLTHAGVYRMVQPAQTQTVPCPWLNLHLRGMTRFRLLDYGYEVLHPGPFLSLGVPGTRVYFETTAPRENYVLMLDGLAVRHAGSEGVVEIAYENAWIPVPGFLFPPPEAIPGLTLEFTHVLECFRNPLPANRLAASLSIASILRRFLEHHGARAPANSPAAALRQLLDDDLGFSKPLPELAKHCGYSPDHMRSLFRREYGISPLEYRNQRRLALAMDLVAKSTLSAKEIAARTGFRYLSHFSLFFRQHAGLSPRAAIARFRLYQTGAGATPAPVAICPREHDLSGAGDSG